MLVGKYLKQVGEVDVGVDSTPKFWKNIKKVGGDVEKINNERCQ